MLKDSSKQQGFTLVELVLTMVILGIIAAVSLPKFFNQSTFDERYFYYDFNIWICVAFVLFNLIFWIRTFLYLQKFWKIGIVGVDENTTKGIGYASSLNLCYKTLNATEP